MSLTVHHLFGCRPEPLGRYLQGLGVLRLVGEQADPDAQGHWTDGAFVLTTHLDEDALITFFLDRYQPTPMISPWNRGSGLRRSGASKSAEDLIAKAEASSDARFEQLRDTIRVARLISDAFPEDKMLDASKDEIVTRARSEMPDAALPWIDASAALASDRIVYPRILGTGGNLGRLDLSAQALEHLDSVIGFDKPVDNSGATRTLLINALFRTGDARLAKKSPGQFDPGQAGGVNWSTHDGQDGLVNPWGLILQLEGAVLFASGVARRLGEVGRHAAMPFTVGVSARGAGHLSDNEPTMAEVWVPLWSFPATAHEIRYLFAEARLRWNGRHAGNGLDATRAVTSFGVDRGITAFSRNVIAERLGQSPLAVPTGRVAVGSRESVGVTAELDNWLRRVRQLSKPPKALQSGLMAAEEAIMDVATGPASETIANMRRVLASTADLENAIRQNRHLRDQIRPLPLLDAERWLPMLDDGSPEFAVAWGLASSHEGHNDVRCSTPTPNAYRTAWRSSVRDYVRNTAGHRYPEWATGPSLDFDIVRDPVGAISTMHVTHATSPRQVEGVAGAFTTMAQGTWVPRGAIERFAAGDLDDHLIGYLVRLLVHISPQAAPPMNWDHSASGGVSPSWRILAPIFHARNRAGHGSPSVAPQPRWPSALSRNAVEPVLREGLIRLKALIGTPRTVGVTAMARHVDGERLAAALFVNPAPSTIERLINDMSIDQDQPPKEDAT